MSTRPNIDGGSGVLAQPNGHSGRRYSWRIILFHLVWVIALIAADFVAQVLIPDENFAPDWYLSFIPLGFIVLAIGLLPVNASIALLLWLIRERPYHRRRLIAFAVSAVVWIVVIVAVATFSTYTTSDALQTAIALGICVPMVGAFIPLPSGQEA
jgi:uncharacterized membrane protein